MEIRRLCEIACDYYKRMLSWFCDIKVNKRRFTNRRSDLFARLSRFVLFSRVFHQKQSYCVEASLAATLLFIS